MIVREKSYGLWISDCARIAIYGKARLKWLKAPQIAPNMLSF